MLLFSLQTIHADVSLPAIFSDHMVLQKAAKVPIWGKATSGEAVTVILNGQTVKTKAAKDGKWRKLTVKVNAPAGSPKMKVNAKSRYFVPKG